MKNLAIFIAALSLSACTTIHFDNGQVDPNSTNKLKVAKWHHNVVNGLVEVSDPVDPVTVCSAVSGADGDWASVKTEKTFINGLAGSAVNSAVFIATFLPLSPWDPKMAEITCR